MIFVHFQSSYIMSSILVKKLIGFYPISGSNTGYYQVEGGGISRPSEMTDMFDTLSIKCRFRWPSFGDSEMVGGLFGFTDHDNIGLLCAYMPGTDGTSGSVAFRSGSSALFSYTLPSLPVSGSGDEVEYRIGSNKVSLLYHGSEVISAVVSDSAGTITDILERVFTLGVYTDASTSYYYPGLISSAEITWLSSAVDDMSCITNYYAAENITDSVWRNTADGVVVGAPALQELPIRAVFYDSSTDSFVKLYPDQITEVNPNYTPIGVEVIPAEHDVYGTGQAGVMSLAEMNYTTPDTGSSSHKYMYWGGYQVDTPLPNFDTVNLVNGTSSSYGYLPSDRFTGATSLDGVSKYSFTSYNVPSPYNADGSRNEEYYTTAYSTANALSDFDGVGNTKVLTDLATTQSDWKNADTITNNSGAGYYPPACCCWRFHTPGTEQGQWYLPACGEMGYVINRVNAINDTINKVISVYSAVAVAMRTKYNYWSSSEYSDTRARVLRMDDGYVLSDDKNYSGRFYVRAFLRL